VIDVERTDFVGIPVTDRARAVKFYGETLGLKRNPLSSDEWPEFETGNVTLLLNTPEQTGVPFSPSNVAIALRVPDVAAAMKLLEDAGRHVRVSGAVRRRRLPHGVLQGSDGNALILHHRYAPYSDGSTP
jgi:catechol 2,3-dioxygenase-like lactoylglutathione lyase family enzyme